MSAPSDPTTVEVNMAQNGAQPSEPGVLARLSTTITVEEGPASYITLWRESSWPNTQPVAITLRPQAEAALLAFLLARRGVTLSPSGG